MKLYFNTRLISLIHEFGSIHITPILKYLDEINIFNCDKTS